MPQWNEDSLVEQPAIEIFQSLRYSYENCYNEIFCEKGGEIDVESLDI